MLESSDIVLYCTVAIVCHNHKPINMELLNFEETWACVNYLPKVTYKSLKIEICTYYTYFQVTIVWNPIIVYVLQLTCIDIDCFRPHAQYSIWTATCKSIVRLLWNTDVNLLIKTLPWQKMNHIIIYHLDSRICCNKNGFNVWICNILHLFCMSTFPILLIFCVVVAAHQYPWC